MPCVGGKGIGALEWAILARNGPGGATVQPPRVLNRDKTRPGSGSRTGRTPPESPILYTSVQCLDTTGSWIR